MMTFSHDEIPVIEQALEEYKQNVMDLLNQNPSIEPGHPDWAWFCFKVDMIKSLSDELERLKNGQNITF